MRLFIEEASVICIVGIGPWLSTTLVNVWGQCQVDWTISKRGFGPTCKLEHVGHSLPFFFSLWAIYCWLYERALSYYGIWNVFMADILVVSTRSCEYTFIRTFTNESLISKRCHNDPSIIYVFLRLLYWLELLYADIQSFMVYWDYCNGYGWFLLRIMCVNKKL